MVYKTVSDTSYYSYNVKDNLVRIDELDKNKKINKALIINLEDKSVIAINPSKKLFTALPRKKNITLSDDGGFDVIKTTNFRTINGYNCNQWRVRNRGLNTEVTYWVAEDKFTFFDELIRVLSTSDRSFSFFLQIPDNQGAMPMLSVERTLLRDEKNSLAVLQINETIVNSALFQVPKDYKTFETNY